MIKLIKTSGRDIQKWEFQTGKKVNLLNTKEQRYLSRRIGAKEFNQPQKHWLRRLVHKFKDNFNAKIGRFINDKAGKVIGTMELQEKFDGRFYLDKKPE